LALPGCATKSRHVMLDGAVIRNETGGPVTDVVVLHEPTMRLGKVSRIVENSSFSLRFAEQPMLGKRSLISWKGPQGEPNLARAVLPLNATAWEQGQVQHLVYVMRPGPRVSVSLRPSP